MCTDTLSVYAEVAFMPCCLFAGCCLFTGCCDSLLVCCVQAPSCLPLGVVFDLAVLLHTNVP